MSIPLIPLLVLVAGCLIYALATNAKAQEIGRAMLWTGLLVTLLVLARWKALGL